MMRLCNYCLPTKKIIILHIHYSIHEWKKTLGKKWRLFKYIIWLGMSCYYCNIHSSNRQKRNWNFIINFPRIGKKRACYPLTYVYIYRYLYNILPTYKYILYRQIGRKKTEPILNSHIIWQRNELGKKSSSF